MGSIGVNRVILGQRREKARCACGSALACGSKERAFSAGLFSAGLKPYFPPAEAGGLSKTSSRGARMGNGVCAAVAFWRYG